MADSAEHLAFRRGRFRWTAWAPKALPGGGIGMCRPCDLGTHWLAQDASGALVDGMAPYAWPTAAEAYAAVERYEQHTGEHGEQDDSDG